MQGVTGFSLQKNKLDVLEVQGSGYEDDHIPEVTGHGADPADISLTNNTTKSNWSMVSYFARLNYNYNDRYFFTASFRGDGSSLFGPLNRWGYFPSVSGGWSISNEKFFQDGIGNNTTLKLRASWGLSGNNNIGNYKYAQVMSSPTGTVIGGSVVSSMYPGSFMDPALGWESTSQLNIGFDLGLFNHRLDLSVNFYNSITEDLLFNQTISAASGSTSYLTNLPDSKIRNRGLDLQLDTRIISRKDFNLNLSGNISFNKNKVLDLGGASTIITNGAERSYMTHITQ